MPRPQLFLLLDQLQPRVSGHALNAHATRLSNRFVGFPEPTQEDSLADGTFHRSAMKGIFADTSFEELSGKVQALGFERDITLAKGYFENSLPAWSGENFAIVHLDCDLYPSYMTCLEFFCPRIKAGGFMVFDEYDFSAPVYPGAQKAIDSFFADKPQKCSALPKR